MSPAEGLVVDSPQDEGCPRISNSLESPFDKGGLRGICELRGLIANLETAPMEAATTHWIPACAGMTLEGRRPPTAPRLILAGIAVKGSGLI